MIEFTAILEKFDEQGEKTGWTYFRIPKKIANQLKPGVRTSYRVKGKIDQLPIQQVAMLPMGEGDFIIPFNVEMRRKTGKRKGEKIKLQLQADDSPFKMSNDLMSCIEDEPKASAHFKTLAGSHQKYFSKWVESAKTEETKAKRIAMAVNALARKLGYPEMIREETAKRKLLR